MTYSRNQQSLSLNNFPAERWKPVTEKMIDSVAARGGVASDLKKYGAQEGT